MSHDTGFKKGYSLVVRREVEAEALLPEIAAAGFDGIEPTFLDGTLPGTEAPVITARELRKRCDDLDLEIPSMRGGRVPWTTIPASAPRERQRALDHTKAAFDALSEMGGRTLLVVPGARTPEVDYFLHWSRVVEYARRAGELAEQYGMKIGFENVEALFPSSLRDWRDLIDEAGHPSVGIYLDVGNITWLGLGYPDEWIRHLGPRIMQVHFKDARFRLSGATLHTEIHQVLNGDLNWPEIMSALRSIGYAGWISVEPEGYKHAGYRLPQRLSADLEAIFTLDQNHFGEEQTNEQ